MQVTEEEFQEYMESALDSIPEGFKSKFENIVFIIEPYPSEHDMERLGLKNRSDLLGLYSGIPYTHRTSWYAGHSPDRIILFQKNIERLCSGKEQLISKIREVVVHEIAHYFGMSESQIREAGY